MVFVLLCFFFFNDKATTEIYTYLHTLSLHDALPILTDARLLLIILALPFLGSLGAAFLPTRGRNRAALLAGAVALAGLVLTVGFYPVLAHGETMRLVIPWLPSLGLDLTLRLNGFSWL